MARGKTISGVIVGAVIFAACGSSQVHEEETGGPTPQPGPTTQAPVATGSPAAGSTCSQVGEQIHDGPRSCVCAPPCLGMEPEVMPPPAWVCRVPDPECPVEAPENGTPCPRPGLRCGWGTCGGVGAECTTGGTWQVREISPPA